MEINLIVYANSGGKSWASISSSHYLLALIRLVIFQDSQLMSIIINVGVKFKGRPFNQGSSKTLIESPVPMIQLT